MNMIFEVADLAVASPATVSRCGMVRGRPCLLPDSHLRVPVMHARPAGHHEHLRPPHTTVASSHASSRSVTRPSLSLPQVYLEPHQLGWRPLLTSWLNVSCTASLPGSSAGPGCSGHAGPPTSPREACAAPSPACTCPPSCPQDLPKALGVKTKKHIEALFDWMLPACLRFNRKEVKEICPTGGGMPVAHRLLSLIGPVFQGCP